MHNISLSLFARDKHGTPRGVYGAEGVRIGCNKLSARYGDAEGVRFGESNTCTRGTMPRAKKMLDTRVKMWYNDNAKLYETGGEVL
jgi:hypothetical protein